METPDHSTELSYFNDIANQQSGLRLVVARGEGRTVSTLCPVSEVRRVIEEPDMRLTTNLFPAYLLHPKDMVQTSEITEKRIFGSIIRYHDVNGENYADQSREDGFGIVISYPWFLARSIARRRGIEPQAAVSLTIYQKKFIVGY